MRAVAVLAGALVVAPSPAGAVVSRGPAWSAPSAAEPCPIARARRGPWGAPRSIGQAAAVTAGADGVTAVAWWSAGALELSLRRPASRPLRRVARLRAPELFDISVARAARDTVVAWQTSSPSETRADLQVATYDGVRWSRPRTLARYAGIAAGSSHALTLAANPQGDVAAVWQASGQIWASVRTAGGDFGAPELVGSQGNLFTAAGGFSAAVDPGGDVVVAFGTMDVNPDGTRRRTIEVVRRPTEGAFQAPQTVLTTASAVRGAALALDGSGNATLVWSQFDGRAFHVEVATASPGATFGPARAISDPLPVMGTRPLALTVAPTGEAIVAWLEPGSAATQIAVAMRPAGSAFGPPRVVGAVRGSARSSNSPLAVIDRRGDAAVIWSPGCGAAPSRILAVTRRAHGAFGPVELVSGRDAGVRVVSPSSLAIDPTGAVTVAWAAERGGAFAVRRPLDGAVGARSATGRPLLGRRTYGRDHQV